MLTVFYHCPLGLYFGAFWGFLILNKMFLAFSLTNLIKKFVDFSGLIQGVFKFLPLSLLILTLSWLILLYVVHVCMSVYMYEMSMYACTYWCKYRHMLTSEHPQVVDIASYLICNNVSLFVFLFPALLSRLGSPSWLRGRIFQEFPCFCLPSHIGRLG